LVCDGWSEVHRRREGPDVGRDPVTGLNDHPEVLAFHRLVFTTPSLAARLTQYTLDNEEALVTALGGDIAAQLTAAQVLAVQRVNLREPVRTDDPGLAGRNPAAQKTATLRVLRSPRSNSTGECHRGRVLVVADQAVVGVEGDPEIVGAGAGAGGEHKAVPVPAT
jgi:hypothetical protein